MVQEVFLRLGLGGAVFRLLGGGGGRHIENTGADDRVRRAALGGRCGDGLDRRHDFGQLLVIRFLGLGLGFRFGFGLV